MPWRVARRYMLRHIRRFHHPDEFSLHALLDADAAALFRYALIAITPPCRAPYADTRYFAAIRAREIAARAGAAHDIEGTSAVTHVRVLRCMRWFYAARNARVTLPRVMFACHAICA